MKYFRKNKGITLVALVITVIVLLILAAVSIATLTGQNGILTRAQEAKNKTEQAQNEEQNILNNYEDKINEYAGIDWDTVLANAEKHPEQKVSTAIGVGTDGRPVNMDLWEYTLLDDETYGLNTKENINTDVSQGVTSGYKGSFTEDGKIEGTIPQYISEDNGGTYREVTDLKWLFFNCNEMQLAPKIPTTVKKMNYTFRNCVNLIESPYIPDSVIELSKTFSDCENLEKVINISSNAINLDYTFNGCKKLKISPSIPNKVRTMEGTFIYCSSLETITSPIPESVINMNRTFYECKSLTGEIVINANLTGNTITGDSIYVGEKDYNYMFLYAVTNENCRVTLTGNCQMLSKIVEQSNNSNIILEINSL